MTQIDVQAFLIDRYGFLRVQPVHYAFGTHVFGVDPETKSSMQFKPPFNQEEIIARIEDRRHKFNVEVTK